MKRAGGRVAWTRPGPLGAVGRAGAPAREVGPRTNERVRPMTQALSPLAAPVAPIRVLMVEDDPADARHTRQLLESSDLESFEIAHATQVEDALQMLQDG